RELAGDPRLRSEAILERLARAMKRQPPVLAPDAIAALEAYRFPGNVRELENILERALALADGNTIHASDLQLPAAASAHPPLPGTHPSPVVPSANAAPGADPRTASPFDTSSSALPSYIEEIERTAIQ